MDSAFPSAPFWSSERRGRNREDETMMRSLFSAVSGLSSHVGMLDVIGNNVANVNTVGFKAARTTFEEALAQTLRSSVQPLGNRGGMNALQIGTGTRLAALDPVFTQGGLETTGLASDLALEGDGFFVLAGGEQQVYTRAGAFRLDAQGHLVSATSGLRVQGYAYKTDSSTFAGRLSDIALPVTQMEPARTTSLINLAGNINSDSEPRGQVMQSSILTTVDGGGATTETALVALGAGGEALLQDGDTLQLSARVNDQEVSAELQLSANTTLEELLTELQTMFNSVEGVSGITATLDGQGRIDIQTPDALGAGAEIQSLAMRAVDGEGDLRIDFGAAVEMQTIQTARDAAAATQDLVIYDSLGQAHTLQLAFTRVLGENAVEWSATVDGGQAQVLSGGSGRITWNRDGSLQGLIFDGGEGATPTGITVDFANGTSSPITIELDAGQQGGFDGLTLLSSETQLMAGQDGYGAGEFVDFQIDTAGVLHGLFSNGVQRPLAQLAVAKFTNPAGLVQQGGNAFAASPNSGQAILGTTESQAGVKIHAGSLEQSNVDLAQEFTQMILAQRGFQASARVLSSADDVLADVINLRR
ncbi:MAG: flagellar hook-basal body complex protein [Candidatus Eisenbacteria bacterium]|nr:flagellar hook-basal body complex protein [Candidatus Eisenbacteria bacterium]